MALDDADSPRSPGWWLLRLGRRLRERHKDLLLYRDYYRGHHPLPNIPVDDVKAFREFQRRSRTNFCRLIVQATVARQVVLGVTDANGDEDRAAWTWFQQNRFDSRQKELYRLLLSTGWAYLMVGPHPADAQRPLITVEHPNEVIVERDPETGDVAAALKAWWDDIDKIGRATVYIGSEIHRFTTDAGTPNRPLSFGARSWTPVGNGTAQANRLGRPPVVAFERIPDLGEDPEPDFWGVRDIQDRINMTVMNRAVVERYYANPQAYATGAQVKKKTDPVTGLEVAENPYPRGNHSVWINENPSGSFGQLQPADLLNLIKVNQMDISTMFVLTSTPTFYMPGGGDLINVSTDTVNALESNHVAKVRELNTGLGEGLEEVAGLAARIAGDDRDFSEHEIRWQDPRELNPAVLVDAAVKKKTIGYPLPMLAEELGESPQRVTRLRQEAAAEQLMLFGQQQNQNRDQAGGQNNAGGGQQLPAGDLAPAIPPDLVGLV